VYNNAIKYTILYYIGIIKKLISCNINHYSIIIIILSLKKCKKLLLIPRNGNIYKTNGVSLSECDNYYIYIISYMYIL